jgi:uncharacterized membrane protein
LGGFDSFVVGTLRRNDGGFRRADPAVSGIPRMHELTLLDMFALAWLFTAWIGFSLFIDHSRWGREGVSAAMAEYRRQWMREMLHRDLRMVDTQILGNLQTGIAFFASTALLVVGGLLGVLRATDTAMEVLTELPFLEASSRAMWELKILLLVAVFVYAFFKLAWSFRLLNYSAILIGAAPPPQAYGPDAESIGEKAAEVQTTAAMNFHAGLRAFFFGLAALAWFLHPGLFILSVSCVLYVLLRREFWSRSARALSLSK